MEIRRLVIHGHVQGVGYRYSMTHEAMRLNIHGWVRNRRDGTVEAMICGNDESVAAMMAWSRQGPPGARVDHIEVELGSGHFTTFEQRQTA